MAYTATPVIELAAAYTPGPFRGPMVSRYVITAPVATTPAEITHAGVVPEGASLAEYDDGVYLYEHHYLRTSTAPGSRRSDLSPPLQQRLTFRWGAVACTLLRATLSLLYWRYKLHPPHSLTTAGGALVSPPAVNCSPHSLPATLRL